jgi:hypothetical protein
MSNFQTAVKSHESSVKNASHAESVGNILDNVENVPFALRGATVKTILYFLFSFIAAAELTAALTFYTASMGLSIIMAAVFCGLLAFGFHALLHGILSDTAKGIVFGKRTESGAMKAEVTGNIILSIVLLAIAACSVFFVGKKGFTAYRATAYEKKQDDAKGKLPPIKSIDASMLTSKSGKISSYKLEMLGDLEKAKAKTTEAEKIKDESEASRYDATTATITDIVGASAFLIELLLALLAYSIATAKLAATMDEIARRNGASQQTLTAQVANVNDISLNDPQSTTQQAQRKIGFSDNKATNTGNEGRVIIRGFQREIKEKQPVTTYRNDISLDDLPENMGTCPICDELFEKKNYKHTYCCEPCRVEAWEQKTGKKFKKLVKS